MYGHRGGSARLAAPRSLRLATRHSRPSARVFRDGSSEQRPRATDHSGFSARRRRIPMGWPASEWGPAPENLTMMARDAIVTEGPET